MKRGQTATEYLLIISLVIIIAIIVVSALGLFPGMASNTEDRSVFAQLQAEKIGVQSYAVTPNGTYVFLKNNHYEMIRITNITIDGQTCDIPTFRSQPPLPITLAVGQERTVLCPQIFNVYVGDSYNYPLQITWVEVSSNARQVINYPVNLVGTVTGTIPQTNASDGGSVFNVQIISPESITYSDSMIPIHFVASEFQSIWYNWNGVNISYTNLTYISFPEGNTTIHVWANNSEGVVVSANTSFIVELPGPPSLFAGGSGSANDPYQIATCQQLQNINTDLIANYILINDVDCSGFEFEPIGHGIGTSNNRFTGTLGGQNNTISNLVISKPDDSYVGLVAHTEITTAIKDIYLVDLYVSGFQNVGGLVGFLRGGSLINVHVQGSISGRGVVGGIIGKTDPGQGSSMSRMTALVDINCLGDICGGLAGETTVYNTITNSAAAGTVQGNAFLGGLVGRAGGMVSRSYADVNITGLFNLGGLVGVQQGSIRDSFATGSVVGSSSTSFTSNIGGLVGLRNSGTISNSYSVGQVFGDFSVGGLVGSSLGGAITTSSYWDVNTSEQPPPAGYIPGGGTPKTTSEMQQQATYVDWDFLNIWDIEEGTSYPWLRNLPNPYN